MKAVKPTRGIERQLRLDGHQVIVGVDEVGRGPLAGPVTVAAVILPARCRLTGVRDSKLMSQSQRKIWVNKIRQQAVAIGVGWASHSEIDQMGLTTATRLAAKRAISDMAITPDVVILDGAHNYIGSDYKVQTCVKADQKCLAVAAASVIAKVARDSYMELISARYPLYEFVSNKGYASKGHRLAIQNYGASPVHRLSWAPFNAIAD